MNSGFGWHIIRVEKRSPAKGEVEASHILKLTRGMDAAQAAVQKHKIDSIYEVVAAGADFAEVAKRESEDPGSARNGGSLGWFGPGMMVQEFDSVSFALPVDGLSKPFATSFGYHIIKKTGARGVKPLSEMRPMIEKAIESDYRASLPERSLSIRLRHAPDRASTRPMSTISPPLLPMPTRQQSPPSTPLRLLHIKWAAIRQLSPTCSPRLLLYGPPMPG